MELPPAEKEAEAKMKELEDHIKRFDGIATVASEMEKMKKELSVLKKRYPQKDLHARDCAQYVGSLADVEEKAAMLERQLRDKLAKQQESYAKLAPEAEEIKKKLKEDIGESLTAIDKQTKHQIAEQAAMIEDGGKHKGPCRKYQEYGKRHGAESDSLDPNNCSSDRRGRCDNLEGNTHW